jgi:hypothetical protein
MVCGGGCPVVSTQIREDEGGVGREAVSTGPIVADPGRWQRHCCRRQGRARARVSSTGKAMAHGPGLYEKEEWAPWRKKKEWAQPNE